MFSDIIERYGELADQAMPYAGKLLDLLWCKLGQDSDPFLALSILSLAE